MDSLAWLCIDEFGDCWLFFFFSFPFSFSRTEEIVTADFSLCWGVARGSHRGIESKTEVRVDHQTIPSAGP